MHRPPDRRDSLRRRVSEGRVRREARERRVYATIRITKRTIAVLAALVMVGAYATVTQVASAEPDPSAAEFIGVGNECAISTDDLEVHVEEEVPGVTHYHYRGHGRPWWWWRKHRGRHGHHHPSPSPDPAPEPGCQEPGAETDRGAHRPAHRRAGNRADRGPGHRADRRTR